MQPEALAALLFLRLAMAFHAGVALEAILGLAVIGGGLSSPPRAACTCLAQGGCHHSPKLAGPLPAAGVCTKLQRVLARLSLCLLGLNQPASRRPCLVAWL